MNKPLPINSSRSPSNPAGSDGNHAAVLQLGGSRHGAVKLLGALVFLFVSAPFVEDLPQGNLIEAILVTLVMIAAVFAVGGQRRTFLLGLMLVTPALVAKWINHLYAEPVPQSVYLVTSTIFFSFVLVQLLRFILHAPEVDGNVLAAGVAGFLTLGLIWIPLYIMVGGGNAAAFADSAGTGATTKMDGFNAFYFSLITLSTVGYGDITPVSKVARMLAVTEAITGLFYMTIFISRLVSLHTANRHAARERLRDPL